jgi:SAM-dependent methyltransferase
MNSPASVEEWERGERGGTPAVDLEPATCPVCRHADGEVVLTGRDRLHDLPGLFSIVRCRTCGLMRTDPRPTASAMGSYYPDDYGPYRATDRDRDGWVRRAIRAIADPLDVTTPPLQPGRLLEIGTASGAYALAMRRRGWSVTGIELDPASARRAAARTGSRILCGDVLTMVLEADHYDLVCAWMALEHVRDPVAALRQCHRWLRPGGWLAFSVPDCGSWQFRVFRDAWFATQLPTHLFHFTEPVLRSLLGRTGYQDIEVRWQRTLFDVIMSAAYLLEDRCGRNVGRGARAAAHSLLGRSAARALGIAAAPLRLTGRITVWARKPSADIT